MDSAVIQEFLGNHPILTAAFVVIVVMLIGNEINRLRRGYKDINPAAAVPLLNQANAVAIDLRGANDFHAGHIIGARNVSLNKVLEAPESLNLPEDAPIMVYCANGTNSSRAAAALVKAGHKQVTTLQGGIAAWQADRFPLESKQSAKKADGGKKKRQQKQQAA